MEFLEEAVVTVGMQASECVNEVDGLVSLQSMHGAVLQSVQGLPWWCDVPPSILAGPATKQACAEEHSSEAVGMLAPLQPVNFLQACSHRAPLPALAQAPIEVHSTQCTSPGLPSSTGREDNQHLLLAMGTGMLHPQVDHTSHLMPTELSQSMVGAAYPFADPYFGGVMASYGAHAMIPPHLLGLQQTRMPLPSEITEEEPVYVNAKQYNGILRRRQSRARAESENKLAKSRKPYLHESRHLHAMRRARGCGGRFLNTKDKDSAKSNTCRKVSEEPSFHRRTSTNSNALHLNKVPSKDYGLMQGYNVQLMVGMGQSLDGGNGHCAEMFVQSDHPIMSSGVSFRT